MFRHVIAPARFFSQVPNEIIRHPRLSSDAVRLLTWQLSLPEQADEPLSKTARRAGIKKCGFQRAKQELKQEGFLHEWRGQGARGRWRTTQFLSSNPVSAEQAAALVEAAATPSAHVPSPAKESAVAASAETGPPPSAAPPAVGRPTPRPVGRQPLEHPSDNTSHPPSAEEAEEFLLSLDRTHPQLAIPPRTAARWAEHVVPWLELGLPLDRIRRTLTDGIDTAHSPMGALHWRLRHALPAPVPASPPPTPRLAAMRECKGTHTQPFLFTPVAEESRCAGCRTATAQAERPRGDGYLTYLTARLATRGDSN